mmetsp:Transcript_24715/g.83071  ORF Transcript_24715/g.83071 Transcript_24715/m.83071 type:complete len:258 (-) Transcript_24715:161-934(-)
MDHALRRRPRRRLDRRGNNARQAKVADLQRAVDVEEQVCGLDVAVDHVIIVDVLHRRQQLAKQPASLREAQIDVHLRQGPKVDARRLKPEVQVAPVPRRPDFGRGAAVERDHALGRAQPPQDQKLAHEPPRNLPRLHVHVAHHLDGALHASPGRAGAAPRRLEDLGIGAGTEAALHDPALAHGVVDVDGHFRRRRPSLGLSLGRHGPQDGGDADHGLRVVVVVVAPRLRRTADHHVHHLHHPPAQKAPAGRLDEGGA